MEQCPTYAHKVISNKGFNQKALLPQILAQDEALLDIRPLCKVFYI